MRITVIGDVLLDRDFDGPADRLSPDGQVPVVEVERRQVRAGGAGLVARLLVGDGHEVTLVTGLSEDRASAELRRCLAGMDVVAGRLNAPTPVKARVFASGRPLVRFDEGCAPGPTPAVTENMLAAIELAEAIVVADYGRGLAAEPRLRSAVLRRALRVPVVWDPHPLGAEPVPGIAVVTPNLAEALGQTGVDADSPRAARRAAALLRDRWRVEAVVVTLGAEGAWVQEGPARGRRAAAPDLGEIDPCGAGDRFAASLAVALADGTGGLVPAVKTAVRQTASFLVGGGVSALPETPTRQASSLPGSAAAIERVRARGGTVVATGGCFDLFHAGHLRTLRAARALGDALVVCLNSDTSVRRLKGPGRPLIGQEDRAELLRALDCVDAVVVFDEDTPLPLLDRLRPDIWVKGNDYRAEELPERLVLARWGGRCVTVPLYQGRSTSALAEGLRNLAS